MAVLRLMQGWVLGAYASMNLVMRNARISRVERLEGSMTSSDKMAVKQLKKSTTSTTQKELKPKDIKNLGADYHIGLWVALLFVGIFIGRVIRRRSSGRYKTLSGYIFIGSISGHGDFEHRLIAEKILQRRLDRWEEVHHINLCKDDNALDNLCVIHREDHVSYHRWHKNMRKQLGKDPHTKARLQMLKERFNGKLLSDLMKKKSG